jgi:hypothetical protein
VFAQLRTAASWTLRVCSGADDLRSLSAHMPRYYWCVYVEKRTRAVRAFAAHNTVILCVTDPALLCFAVTSVTRTSRTTRCVPRTYDLACLSACWLFTNTTADALPPDLFGRRL